MDLSIPADSLNLKVDLQNSWERQYLAHHLGVTEQALAAAAAAHDGTSIEALCRHLFQ